MPKVSCIYFGIETFEWFRDTPQGGGEFNFFRNIIVVDQACGSSNFELFIISSSTFYWSGAMHIGDFVFA